MPFSHLSYFALGLSIFNRFLFIRDIISLSYLFVIFSPSFQLSFAYGEFLTYKFLCILCSQIY